FLRKTADGIRLDQRRVFRLRAGHPRLYRRASELARERRAGARRGRWAAAGLPPSRLLPADGHAAREAAARGILGKRQSAVGMPAMMEKALRAYSGRR